MREGQTQSVEQTQAIGRVIGGQARAGDLIALIGELGAGKTQLVRGLAMGMGCDPATVASPTFVMVHEYLSAPIPGAVPGAGRSGLVLVHIDAYRLKGREDLESIGWDQTGTELSHGAVVAIEWADRLDSALGEHRLEVRLAHHGEDRRAVVVLAKGGWRGRMAALRSALDRVL